MNAATALPAKSCPVPADADLPWFDNGGRPPARIFGDRVRVQLRSGYDSAETEPNGWPVGTSNWKLTGGPCDILRWQPLQPADAPVAKADASRQWHGISQ